MAKEKVGKLVKLTFICTSGCSRLHSPTLLLSYLTNCECIHKLEGIPMFAEKDKGMKLQVCECNVCKNYSGR